MNIWQQLGSFIAGLLSTVIRLFPVASTDNLNAFTRNITAFRSELTSVSWLFPVNELLLLLGIIISIELSLFTYRLIKYILHNISLGFIKA